MTNEQRLLRFTDKTWGKDFKFRKYQKEVILDILNHYDKNPSGSYILDAPTGTGKSIIGMCVAGVLQSKNKTGYILTSDLGLQQQYTDEFEAAAVQWFTVKGKSNYMCDANGQTADVGDCIIHKTPAVKMECYTTCAYYNARQAAQASAVTLLNYSYWLMQMNFVLPNIPGDNAPFHHRDFIIADEAHKITEIVQSHFSPRISKYTSKKLEKLNIFVSENDLGSLGFLTEEFNGLLDEIIKTESTSKIYKCLLEMECCLGTIMENGEDVAANLNIQYKGEDWPKHIEVNRVFDNNRFFPPQFPCFLGHMLHCPAGVNYGVGFFDNGFFHPVFENFQNTRLMISVELMV